jgi:hypothetical protein
VECKYWKRCDAAATGTIGSAINVDHRKGRFFQ